MSEWISVKDRLPEENTPVLCIHTYYTGHKYQGGATHNDYHNITIGSYNGSYWTFIHYLRNFKRKGYIWDCDFACPGNEYITHWMPLPPAYEGE